MGDLHVRTMIRCCLPVLLASLVLVGPPTAGADPLPPALLDLLDDVEEVGEQIIHDALEPLALDLTGLEPLTTVLDPLSLPEMADGAVGPGTRLLVRLPGVGAAMCTAGYVWRDELGRRYVGTAGHCLLDGDATATHGPGADFDASALEVFACIRECEFGGFLSESFRGDLVALGDVAYARQESPRGVDVGHDFGLVEVPAGVPVRATMPVFDGPFASGSLGTGDLVCHYGNGILAGEIWPTMGRAGIGLGASDTTFAFLGAVTPGDSGSAAQVCVPSLARGVVGTAAVGIVTHLDAAGVVGTTVAQAEAMARADAGLDLELVLGTP